MQLSQTLIKKYNHYLLPGLMVLAAGLRIALIPTRLLLENDAPYYVALAAQILRGDWTGALNDYWSQFYPLLIALVGIIIHDHELAARLVSALCGTALIPAVWWLVREFADTASARLAAILAIFQPWLLVFSVLALTEMTFTFLMVTSLALILRATRLGGLGRFALAGGVTAVTILTRSEGLLLVAFLLAAGLIRLIRRRTLRVIREMAVAFVMLLVVLAPQSIGTYRIYGHLNSSWKSSVSLVVGEASENPSETERAMYGLNEQGARLLDIQARQASLGQYWLEYPQLAFRRVWENAGVIWRGQMLKVWMPIQTTSDPLAVVIGGLAGFGLLTYLTRAKWRSLIAILGFMTVYILGLSSVLVHPRLLVPLAPFSLIFIAMGCSSVIQAGKLTIGRWLPVDWQRIAKRTFLLISMGGLLGMAIEGYIWAYDGRDPFSVEPIAEKQAGSWLQANAPQTAKLLSHNPQTPFYFYKDWPFDRAFPLPWAPPPSVLAYAHGQGADYIVMEEWVIGAGHFPVETWLDTSRPHAGLKLREIFGKPPYRVIIYQLTDERSYSFDPAETGYISSH